jgi:hypothetical protein
MYLVEELRKFKIVDISAISKSKFRGYSDEQVIKLANKQQRTLITADRGFLRVNYYRKARYGVIYINIMARGEVDQNAKLIIDIPKLKNSLAKIKDNKCEIFK